MDEAGDDAERLVYGSPVDESMRSELVRQTLAHQDPRTQGERLADQHGRNFGVVWRWVLDEARRRAEQQLPADGLMARPSTPEDLLFDLLDQERFISALGHRAGPRRLLERLAEEHDYDEAITTLALSHYASDDYPLADFLAFVRRHRACAMFDHNLRRARHLPADRHRAALAILDAGEAG